MDVLQAYGKIALVKEELQSVRDNAEAEFSKAFELCGKMADEANQTITLPRECKRQIHRNRVTGATPEEFYRRNTFVPLVDHMINQLCGRFTSLTSTAVKVMLLLPKFVDKLTDTDLKNIIEAYENDLPSPSVVEAEVRLWKRLWQSAEVKPDNLASILSHPECTIKIFPNLYTLFSIVNVLLLTAEYLVCLCVLPTL